MSSPKYLINPYNTYNVKGYRSEYNQIYYKGKYYFPGQLDFNKDNFTVDNGPFKTFESFGKSNDYVILIDDRVCYFKFYITDSNNEVFASQYGDFILTPTVIKESSQRLRHK
jgi:hypothetical protein